MQARTGRWRLFVDVATVCSVVLQVRCGRAEAAAPFRAWHASTRHRSVGLEAPQPRFAYQALPDPATPTLGERSWSTDSKAAPSTVPAVRARATPGEPDAFLPGDKAVSRQAGVVGSGRAWGAKRGGNVGDATVSRRVLAHQALNGSTASA